MISPWYIPIQPPFSSHFSGALVGQWGPAQQRDLPRPCGVLPEAPEMAPGVAASGRHGARRDLSGQGTMGGWSKNKHEKPMDQWFYYVLLLQWSIKTGGPWRSEHLWVFRKTLVGLRICHGTVANGCLKLASASFGGQAQWLWRVVTLHFSICSCLRKKGCSYCSCLLDFQLAHPKSSWNKQAQVVSFFYSRCSIFSLQSTPFSPGDIDLNQIVVNAMIAASEQGNLCADAPIGGSGEPASCASKRDSQRDHETMPFSVWTIPIWWYPSMRVWVCMGYIDQPPNAWL